MSNKSNAELQIEEAINHMNVMISKIQVTISDSKYLVDCAVNVWMKCEELRISRDKWRLRAEKAEKELKDGIN